MRVGHFETPTSPGVDGYDYVCNHGHMMTRKDFEAIAHCLDANRAPLAMVLDFADMLGEQNPRFNRQAFVVASTGNYALDVAADLNLLRRERSK